MTTMIERVARAMDEADLGYSIQLVRLVDGVATYELRDGDRGESLFYPSHAEAAEAIAAKRRLVKARAAIEAMRRPDNRMAGVARNSLHMSLPDIWQAMIDAALSEKEPT